MVGEERGDHLLVRGREHERPVALVLEREQHGPEGLAAARALPELPRLDRGQQHLLRSGAVHLLAHDALHALLRATAERQEAVDPGHELVDVARAQQQPVGRRLGLGRGFPQRVSKEP